MQHYHDIVLYKTHQHVFVLIARFLQIFIPFVILILWGGIFSGYILIWVIVSILGWVWIFWFYYFFWSKSYFIITNEKIVVKVRNGIFSKFHMNIYFKNIRDMAFAKNNMFHYMLWYGTIFARSSAGAVGDLEAQYIPQVEKVYKILNALYSLSEEERKNITSLDAWLKFHFSSQDKWKIEWSNNFEAKQKIVWDIKWEKIQSWKEETLEQAIEKEKNILLGIQGIKEVVLLDGKDRRYIFEHEEERNHGVHECLRRQVLFAATHDSTLRQPDEAIVMQAGEKVIFPVVEFHEIKRKKVSSSSPWLIVHEYLVPKFQDFDDYDATLLIWFDK